MPQFVFYNEPGNFTIGIVEVAKHPHPGHAGRHTGGLPALFNQLDAEPAFFDIALFLDNPDIIRTGGNAIFTPDAFILVHQADVAVGLEGLHVVEVEAVEHLHRTG